MRKPLIVAYDVADPKRLQAVRLSVTDWAHGGQKSVWECWASDPRMLVEALQSTLDPSTDKLALLRHLDTQPRSLGAARPSRDRALLFIG